MSVLMEANAMQPESDPAAAPELVVSPGEDGWSDMSLSPPPGWVRPGGDDFSGPFYRTRRPIENPRVIVVPQPPPAEGEPARPQPTVPTMLALWDERSDDGALVYCRAIRHAEVGGAQDRPHPMAEDYNGDGVADLGWVCMGEIDYRVMLWFGEFDPVGRAGDQGRPGVGEPTDFPEGLRAADVPGRDGAGGGGCHLYLVQFWTQPLPEFTESLIALGATVRNFIGESTHIVQMTDDVAGQVTALPFVRWVGAHHPAYRTAPDQLDAVFGWRRPADPASARPYDIGVFGHGPTQRALVAGRIEAMGGTITEFHPRGHLFTAALTPQQLGTLLGMDELQWVSPWAPLELGTDLARSFSGADFLDAPTATPPRNFRGQGVRGEILDTDILETHVAFTSLGRSVEFHGVERPSMIGQEECTYEVWNGPNSPRHGTSTYGIAFGNAPGSFRGILPEGTGIFASCGRLTTQCQPCCFAAPICCGVCNIGCGQCGDACDRHEEFVTIDEHAAELVALQAVFQSSSIARVGHSENYDQRSEASDRVAFANKVLFCQAQGNQGATATPTNSFQEAWAKNVLSVGGVKHRNTPETSDDCWCPVDDCFQPCGECVIPSYHSGPPQCPIPASGHAWSGLCHPETPLHVSAASSGPSSDTTRVKPDLVHFYDAVKAPGPVCNNPNQFYNTDYLEWFSGTSAATPVVAGHAGLFYQMWHEGVFAGYGGNPLLTVYSDAPHPTTAKAMLINTAFQYPLPGGDLTRMRQGWGVPDLQAMYNLRNNFFIVDESMDLTMSGQVATYSVFAGGLPLKVTMVYADPPGTTGTTLHRIYDLHLRVVSPGGTTYWGNKGLIDAIGAPAQNWSVAGGKYDTHNTVENVFIQSPQSGYWTIEVQLHTIVPGVDGNPETPGEDVDFALVVSGVAPSAAVDPDWNGDKRIDLADLTYFISDFLRGEADVDLDGATAAMDLFAFLDLFFSPPK